MLITYPININYNRHLIYVNLHGDIFVVTVTPDMLELNNEIYIHEHGMCVVEPSVVALEPCVHLHPFWNLTTRRNYGIHDTLFLWNLPVDLTSLMPPELAHSSFKTIVATLLWYEGVTINGAKSFIPQQ
ncbi:hypothetical protein E2542_SST01739 [Spatholobus suberectus]|nr:hypothetical protein E2542_SST01739 [Spatholobus suberectus]